MKKPRPAKTIGRKRRAAGWPLLALGVLVAGVWAESGFVDIQVPSPAPHQNLIIYKGALRVVVPAEVRDRDSRLITTMIWLIDEAPTRWELWPRTIGNPTLVNGPRGYVLPFWPVPLVLWASAALLLRSGILARRRAMTNACAKCGYSLAGLAQAAPCPECGKTAEVAKTG